MKPSTTIDLRNAWKGPLTLAEVADRFNMHEKAVRRFWAVEKSAGRLPADEARPFFVARCRAAGEASLDAEIDRSERIAEQSEVLNISASDQLLVALRKHHRIGNVVDLTAVIEKHEAAKRVRNAAIVAAGTEKETA